MFNFNLIIIYCYCFKIFNVVVFISKTNKKMILLITGTKMRIERPFKNGQKFLILVQKGKSDFLAKKPRSLMITMRYYF